MVNNYVLYRDYPKKIFKTFKQLEEEKVQGIYLQNITKYLRQYFDSEDNLLFLEIRDEEGIYAILYTTDVKVKSTWNPKTFKTIKVSDLKTD